MTIGDFFGQQIFTSPWVPEGTFYILPNVPSFDTKFDIWGWDDLTPTIPPPRSIDTYGLWRRLMEDAVPTLPDPPIYLEVVAALGQRPLSRTPKPSARPFVIAGV